MSAAASQSVLELKRRCEQLPELLSQVLELSYPDVSITRAHTVLVTGAGLAEGPARQLAAQWRAQLGVCTDFVPLTAFMMGTPRKADVLIVCSQGLCPNARLALPSLGEFKLGVLISSVRWGDRPLPKEIELWLDQGGVIWDLPPDEESGGFLIRVQGPTLYTLAISCWTAHLKDVLHGEPPEWKDALAQVPEAYAARFGAVMSGECDVDPSVLSWPNLALLSFGHGDDLSQGLRWKLLEGLWRQAPPVFDLLQVVHGPWQGFYHQEMALLALVDASCSVQTDLLQRLEGMLSAHHELVRVDATLPSPLGYFEFAAQLDAMIILENMRLGVDLVAWPGRGEDGPLYGVAANPITTSE